MSEEKLNMSLWHRMKRRARNQEFARQYLKEHPCVDCGNDDIRVLDFDHRRAKIRNVTSGIHKGWTLERLKEEMDKCDVRCKNCHAIRHMEENNCWRVQ
jgi:hypothetical protein